MPASPKYQRPLDLITRQVNESVIEQRSLDGYINATQLCHVAGKRWYNYLRDETSGHFLRALETKTRIGVSELIQEVHPASGPANTWIHPKVAIHLAQWLSAEFAVQVSEWVYEWISRRPPVGAVKLPIHLERYLTNDPKVPFGYFSILQETALGLFGPLHNVGFDIPDGWVPDISVGKLFCSWLRVQRKLDTDILPTYPHSYQDGRVVDAKIYPDELLADYRRWFRTTWLPQYGVNYFKRKDPSTLVFLDKIPALAAPANQPKVRKRA